MLLCRMHQPLLDVSFEVGTTANIKVQLRKSSMQSKLEARKAARRWFQASRMLAGPNTKPDSWLVGMLLHKFSSTLGHSALLPSEAAAIHMSGTTKSDHLRLSMKRSESGALRAWAIAEAKSRSISEALAALYLCSNAWSCAADAALHSVHLHPLDGSGIPTASSEVHNRSTADVPASSAPHGVRHMMHGALEMREASPVTRRCANAC